MRILGIDPGGRWTGVVLRNGDAVEYVQVVTRRGTDWRTYRTELEQLLYDMVITDEAVTHVGLETINKPTPQMGITSVQGLIDTARVLGWVESFAADFVVLVPPGGHGNAPLRTYPAVLIGDKETKGTGVLRHARSAYDVAGAAATMLRIDERRKR